MSSVKSEAFVLLKMQEEAVMACLELTMVAVQRNELDDTLCVSPSIEPPLKMIFDKYL